MDSYKNYTTITSQLYFCSSPIRLDTYNKCQFGCVYCFSRNRKGEHSENTIKKASASGFEKRLERINCGIIQSGLDEFIQRKVPIQLGGLYDPFSPMELFQKATHKVMTALADYKYPTLISTKGNIFMLPEYSNLLKRMNVYIRLSSSGIAEKYRNSIDVGCDSFAKVLDKIKFVSDMGLPVSLRIQPVIPGFEEDALIMVEKAVNAGVSHVSFEYLKITSESKDRELRQIYKSTGVNLWEKMTSLGLTKIGRDYTLSKEAKLKFLKKAKKLCSSLGIKFGAGDTEFIHLSDGNGCCNGSGLFLKDSNQFRGNFVGVLSSKENGNKVKFEDLSEEWIPTGNIHRYLTTNSRTRDMSGKYPSLLSLLAHRWNGGKGPYSPAFFYGVSWDGEFDKNGFKIYNFDKPF